MSRFALHALAAVAAVILAGCAIAQQIAPGMPRAEVLARMGRPTGVVSLGAGGERLQYSYQPAGQVAWMIDLDSAGRVTQVRQVLADTEFDRIVVGEWTGADVEREFGRAAAIQGGVITYRWRNVHGGDMFLWVYVDPQGVVRGVRKGSEIPGNMSDL